MGRDIPGDEDRGSTFNLGGQVSGFSKGEVNRKLLKERGGTL